MNHYPPLTHTKTVYEYFRYFYGHDVKNVAMLKDIYHNDIVFKDPIHQLQGLHQLQQYFSTLTNNMNTCRFEFADEIRQEEKMHVTWNMHFSHSKIANGWPQILRGMSVIHIVDNKVIYHEDCYDVGAMVYEHVPVLGRMTRWVKKRVGAIA